jgi:hypothetical protein
VFRLKFSKKSQKYRRYKIVLKAAAMGPIRSDIYPVIVHLKATDHKGKDEGQ